MASIDRLTYDRHPKLCELRQKGCTDNDMAAMATHVYLELSKVQKWRQVELCFSDELTVAYVTGHPNEKDAPFKVVVPVCVQNELTFDDLKRFQRICPQSSGSVILGFVDQDSTVVYYEITEGLSRNTDLGSRKEEGSNDDDETS